MNSSGKCSRQVSRACGLKPTIMWKRPKNRRKQNERRLRVPTINWRGWGIAAAIVVALLCGGAALSMVLDQPIQRVAISGSFQRVSPGDIERAVKDKVRTQGLVSVDLEAVKRAVASLPWVDTASVQRSWPRALQVTVVEQIAAARWGENGLL